MHCLPAVSPAEVATGAQEWVVLPGLPQHLPGWQHIGLQRKEPGPAQGSSTPAIPSVLASLSCPR